MWCSARADGYETLPGASTEGEEAKAAAKEQAAREDKYERLLMDVYNALYKVDSGLAPEQSFGRGTLSPLWVCSSHFTWAA